MLVLSRRLKSWLQTVSLALALTSLTGCITFSEYAVPADRIPESLRAPEKGQRLPLNYALLGQPAVKEYILGPGDVLGTYIKGVLPEGTSDSAPLIQGQANFSNIYYPPTGQSMTPSVGIPIEINAAGCLQLPNVGDLQIQGLTIDQAAKLVAQKCVELEIVQEGKEYVYLTLVRSRVTRFMVVRDEIPSDSPSFLSKTAPVYAKHGHSQVVDLPAYQNDVLHALTISGGLPGYDAFNEVWILRRNSFPNEVYQQVWNNPNHGEEFQGVMNSLHCETSSLRIPLWVNPCDAPSITPNEITLSEGDIVYVRARTQDFFYTAGLLPGGVVPMPRDHDIDIVEAISLANGSVGGAGGASGITVVRTGSGPGNIIPPSRATILRKLPNKQQVAIRVDLSKSIRDPKHRPIVQAGDLISLHYKPGEVTANSLLNMVNFNYIIPGG